MLIYSHETLAFVLCGLGDGSLVSFALDPLTGMTSPKRFCKSVLFFVKGASFWHSIQNDSVNVCDLLFTDD